MSKWKSGWCETNQCYRCVGEGPSAGSKDGKVLCAHECHQKRREAAKKQWKGLK